MTERTQARIKAIEALESERAYQDQRWADSQSSGRPSDRKDALDRTIDEFVLYIKGYADELVQIASHSDNPTAKLAHIRKVGGLCIAAMEAHGAPPRKF